MMEMRKIVVCIIALFILPNLIFVSNSWAGKPTAQSIPGYALFRDSDLDVIKSDGKDLDGDGNTDPFIDYRISLGQGKKGQDYVEINISNTDGSFRWLKFYPGKMYQYNNKPSKRRVQFCFDVSQIVYPTNIAVLDLLRKYKSRESYLERSSTNTGFIDDYSIHSPIMINVEMSRYSGDDIIQFAVDPNPDTNGTDPKAITQESVDNYYLNDINQVYWYTADENRIKYIIYSIELGYDGFSVIEADWINGKPITWLIKTTRGYGRLCVFERLSDGTLKKVYLGSYNNNLNFEFAVSIQPLYAYPSEPSRFAPPKYRNISTVWGEIKLNKLRQE